MNQRHDIIATLARGLAAGASVRIAFSESQWAWQPDTRTLVVGTRQLDTQPLEVGLGLVAHEIGHCAISRYLDLAAAFRPAVLRPEQWLEVLNVLEDSRVEGWIVADFTGTVSWLEALHETMLAIPWPPPPEVPGTHVISLAHLREWMLGWERDPDLPDDVLRVLDATRVLRRAYAATWPQVHGLDPVRREAAVVASALQAMPLAVRFGTWIGQAWHAEVAALAAALGVDPALEAHATQAVVDRNLAQAWQVLRQAQGFTAASARDNPVAAAPTPASQRSSPKLKLATDLRLLIDRGEPVGRPMATRRGRCSSPPVGTRPGLPPTASGSNASGDARLPSRQALVAQVRLALSKVFPPEAAPTWTRDHPSGRRLDLRRALQGQADPRQNRHLWQRRSQPTRADAAVLLLVDLSGSMARDGRIGAAVLATSVCAQALREWHIPTAIVGFQDELVPIAGFDEPWTPALAQRIAAMAQEVEGTRPGGHNRPSNNDDGPCLREAAALLLRRGEQQRVLVVLSDGRPSGRRSTAADLHGAIADLQKVPRLALAGLGVGEGTRHVERFYPDAQGGVPVEAFPAQLAATLVRRLAAGRGGQATPAEQRSAPSGAEGRDRSAIRWAGDHR